MYRKRDGKRERSSGFIVPSIAAKNFLGSGNGRIGGGPKSKKIAENARSTGLLDTRTPSLICINHAAKVSVSKYVGM